MSAQQFQPIREVPPARVLLVEDDLSHVELIARAFVPLEHEYTLTAAQSLKQANAVISRRAPDLVLADYRLPDGQGQELIALAAGAFPVVLMTAYGDEKLAVQAIKAGALDYVVKSPEIFATMPRTVARCLREWETQAQHKRMENALRESEARFRAIFDSTFQFTGLMTPEGVLLEANRTMLDFLGVRPNEVIQRPIWEVLRTMGGSSVGAERLKIAVRDAAGGQFVRYETAICGAGDKKAIVDFSIKPVFDTSGKVALLIPEGRDITDRKHDEAERAKLQEQLLQAQKLESVGRLAGGVAHDFNNMLSVILGHTDLILLQTKPDNPLYPDLVEIEKTAQRSADLTRQLLAFARKQTVSPKVLDLNDTVSGMLKMLRRLIGENIELVWQPGNDLWPVNIDPSQIDQVLANLAVNARDAISNIGQVTICTSNETFTVADTEQHPTSLPGEFVRLSVSDNGCGMNRETLERIFEPFYTTKSLGRGTGLGLATVYGIIKQNDGFIRATSKPGQGSTFNLYIPRHVGGIAMPSTPEKEEAPKGGNETILLVEDEPAMLSISRSMLIHLGYRVLASGTPEEALQMADNDEHNIDLLITDVIMPGMNGRDLARVIDSQHPGLRHLFTSGYTADVMAARGILDKGIHFIQKPFTINGLAAKVREVLET